MTEASHLPDDSESTAPLERIITSALSLSGMTAADASVPPGGGDAWRLLAELTDRIGPRLSGSPQAEAAVAWGETAFRERGVRAWRDEVVVPHWVRGDAAAVIASHARQPLTLVALGGSVATPEGGLVAEVVAVDSLDEIERLGDSLRGKVVLMNKTMDMSLVARQRAFDAYREVAPLRQRGPGRAAEHGAAAFLIRSLGSLSYRLAHAGALVWSESGPRIPAAAITAEDAELLGRLLASGECVTVELRLTPRTLPDVTSANVVAEVEGREPEAGAVLIGAHLDSWDVSPGAHDNGSGVAMVIETLRLLSEAGLRPRRSVHGVLFMNEENGGRGGAAYHRRHRQEPYGAVVETDHGAWVPIGFDATLPLERLRGLDSLIERLEARGVFGPLDGRAARIVQETHTGVDTAHFVADGVPGFALMPDPRHYFDLHHTAADTLDKVEPAALARCLAAFAGLVWTLAEQGVDEGSDAEAGK